MNITRSTLATSIIAASLAMMTTTSFSIDTLICESTQSKSTQRALNPYERPDYLQDSIDDRHTQILRYPPQWNYNGSSSYEILVDCAQMIKSLIKASPDQKEFYVLDIGAGNLSSDSSWGKSTVCYINEQFDLPEDILIHVISVTGENYGGLSVEKIGKCKLYNIDAFKIEDLHKSFNQLSNQLGLNLENNLDLIVSSYTFIHLLDAVGTFVQAYNFLRPERGIILSHGFPVYYGPREHYSLNHPMVKFLLSTKAPCLVCDTGNRDITPFLMKRPDNKPLSLALEYAGTIYAEVANTRRKPVAYFNQLEKVEEHSLNMPNWQISAIHGDRDLFEWVWAHYPEWQTKTVTWQPLIGTEEEGKKAQIKKLPPPLFHAVYEKNQSVVEDLFAKGADVNQKNAMGRPLIFTTYNQDMQIFLLKQKGFDPNATDEYGQSVVHHLEGSALLQLMQMRPNLNAQDRHGDTALHKAIWNAQYGDIVVLLENGANPKIRNLKGETPFELEAAKEESTAQIIADYTTSKVVISNEDYHDTTGNLVASLKDNSSVVSLTIHKGFNIWDNTCYNNYHRVILEGLQNKPNLKSLTIVGDFDLPLFLQENRCIGNLSISPDEFLKLPHMACFANLEELKVGMLRGGRRNDSYFYTEFLRSRNLPNLKKFVTTDSTFSSFERN